ncbi:MAG: hypothetical protein M0Z95_15115 [Actinomycetota bacterium]|nr:hypothetical protein [Actinomycetota bacterium]
MHHPRPSTQPPTTTTTTTTIQPPTTTTTTQPPTPLLYVSVEIGPVSGGAVAVTATATLTEGTAPGAGLPVSFEVGGGCSPAAVSSRTDGAGSAVVDISCPLSTTPIVLTATSAGTQAATSFVAEP